MAQAALEVQQLVGQNRNQVHGQIAGGLIPQRVFNFAPHRAGGYAPYGRRVRLQDGTPADVTLTDITRVIGYDQTGLSSYGTTVASTGTWSLFRGTTIYSQRKAAYSTPSDAVHLANAGAYNKRDEFLVLDKDLNQIEPLALDARAVAESGANAQTTELVNGGVANDVQYGNGIFMMVTRLGYIYTSSNGIDWTEVADYSAGWSGLGSAKLLTVDYGNGVWVVGDEHWAALRSDDDGATWTEVSVLPGKTRADVSALSLDMLSISYSGSGDVWYATGRGGEYDSIDMGIRKSIDGGQTWTGVDDMQEFALGGNYIFKGTRVVVGGGGTSAVNVARLGSKSGVDQPGRLYADVGLDDSWADVPDAGLDTSYRWQWTDAVDDRYVAINVEGQVATSPAWDVDPSAVTETWSIVTTLSGYLIKTRYDENNGTFTVVGSTSAGANTPGKIWQGDSPSSLSSSASLEAAWLEAGGGAINSVAYADDGTTVYVGRTADSGVPMSMQTGPSTGLAAGTYNLFYLTYANTEAGRLVLDYGRETLQFTADSGNSISIQAQTKDKVIANNTWLNTLLGTDAAAANAIIDSLRMGVYIQYLATTADITEDETSFSASTAENTIRYAFTVELPDDPDQVDGSFGSVGRSLGQLPIGRQLVTYGWPTTAIFEKSRTVDANEPIRSYTAVHNGRVWGLARQDETEWEAQGDDASLEIANQYNRFVLTYSETGWANLISDQNFIPIQPTQSHNFTGIVGTPSGLMVMFDNEIFIVTGDPAFNNLAVDVYLDMVGCDLGTVPTTIGGLVFVIWEGKVWTLQAGQAAEVSTGQWRPDDPFVHVVAEPQTRCILALTESGLVFRYLVDDNFWLIDPMTTDTFAPVQILPNAIDPDSTDDEKGRVRAVDASGNVYVTYTDGTPDDPHLVYREVDFGTPERRNALYLTKVTVEGPLAAAEYDRDAVGYDATALPALFYASANSNNGNTHETVDAQAGGIAPYASSPGALRVNTLSFRTPLRQTRSFSMNLRLEMRGMAYTDVLKLPIRLFYSTGGTTR